MEEQEAIEWQCWEGGIMEENILCMRTTTTKTLKIEKNIKIIILKVLQDSFCVCVCMLMLNVT